MSQLPKRLQDWDGCPHVTTCTHCGGHGFLRGVLGREECPACQKRGVRWLGTISPEMQDAGYHVVGRACFFSTSDAIGSQVAEPSVLANLWHFAGVNGGAK